MNTCIRRQKGRNGVERSNPSWGPRWLEVPRLGETGGFHSASSKDGLSRLGAISSHALGVAKVVEQEGPVLQLQEAKAHPKEGMYLPLAFMDVNVKDSVGKVDSPEMVSSVPTVGIHAGRELGSCGAVLSCKGIHTGKSRAQSLRYPSCFAGINSFSTSPPPGRGGHGIQLMYGPPRAGGVTLYCRFCTSDVKMFRFVASFH